MIDIKKWLEKILVDAYDSSAVVSDRDGTVLERLEEIADDTDSTLSGVNNSLALKQAFNTTTTTKNSSVTLFALDGMGGPKKDIKVEFFLDDDAAATFTPAWYVTRAGDPTTFIQLVNPPVVQIVLPPADICYQTEFGDLAEGQQVEFRIAQDNNGDATNAIDTVLTYMSRI